MPGRASLLEVRGDIGTGILHVGLVSGTGGALRRLVSRMLPIARLRDDVRKRMYLVTLDIKLFEGYTPLVAGHLNCDVPVGRATLRAKEDLLLILLLEGYLTRVLQEGAIFSMHIQGIVLLLLDQLAYFDALAAFLLRV